ncbi:MAG: hypothetical protein HYX38_09915 [Rhodospirillales bacterium]|nr:hypothetical protein [Rhodospirillales bacterium]
MPSAIELSTAFQEDKLFAIERDLVCCRRKPKRRAQILFKKGRRNHCGDAWHSKDSEWSAIVLCPRISTD